ncbi:glycosyltransferase family 2 protein [Candidatus Micrarchaeota archaeon]|nr:glycosyltransferase family 2 protein [Candidatus Micrarchaeota archaeon]
MLISIVIPVFNEVENIKPLLDSLKKESKELKKLGHKVEVVLVDDGSNDGTFDRIQKNKKGLNVRAIRFRRNFGQTAAFDAGFKAAKGDVIITMDGDLQNDPKDIPSLLKELSKGHDVVSGWRFERQDSFTKKLPSLFSNFLARSLTGLQLHDFGCSLKAYKKETLKDLRLFGEMHRYIPAILYTKGYKISEVKVSHHPRKFGYTKYNFTRLLKGFLDLLYIKFWSSFSTRPLHLFGFMGALMFLFSGLIFLYKFFALVFLGLPVEVTPSLIIATLFSIMAVQFIMFGFLSEIQVRTYYNTAKENEYEIEKSI